MLVCFKWYYYDFSTSYFREKVDVTLTNTISVASGTTVMAGNGCMRFERRPERLFQRVLIQDASSNF